MVKYITIKCATFHLLGFNLTGDSCLNMMNNFMHGNKQNLSFLLEKYYQ